MFCQNCGKKIKENDVFCGSCGAKVITSSENAQKSSDDNENYRDSSMQNSEKDNGINHESYTQEHIDFKETVFGKVMHNYFKKPLSIFSLMKDEDTTKTSIGFLIGIPILYGLFPTISAFNAQPFSSINILPRNFLVSLSLKK